MKKEIHPKYHETQITCVCGNIIETGSTVENVHVEICSNCHPFFTGKQKLVDTAGRIHTKSNLMEELKKIQRTIAKKIPDGPHEILLVLDATTGQNALSQAKLFNEALGITGLVLTKLDGTAKGGIVVSICTSLNLPLKYIGVGEGIDDLQPFDPKPFVEALL